MGRWAIYDATSDDVDDLNELRQLLRALTAAINDPELIKILFRMALLFNSLLRRAEARKAQLTPKRGER